MLILIENENCCPNILKSIENYALGLVSRLQLHSPLFSANSASLAKITTDIMPAIFSTVKFVYDVLAPTSPKRRRLCKFRRRYISILGVCFEGWYNKVLGEELKRRNTRITKHVYRCMEVHIDHFFCHIDF